MGCKHGICRSPNFCACEVGWEGVTCDTCIPMPGCKHGHCVTALECNCDDGWGGGKCDIRECFSIYLLFILVNYDYIKFKFLYFLSSCLHGL